MILAEMTTSEIFTELSDTQKDELYRMLQSDKVQEDVLSVLEAHGVSEDNIEAIAERIVNAYVYEGEYDTELPYWVNLENLVDRYAEG